MTHKTQLSTSRAPLPVRKVAAGCNNLLAAYSEAGRSIHGKRVSELEKLDLGGEMVSLLDGRGISERLSLLGVPDIELISFMLGSRRNISDVRFALVKIEDATIIQNHTVLKASHYIKPRETTVHPVYTVRGNILLVDNLLWRKLAKREQWQNHLEYVLRLRLLTRENLHRITWLHLFDRLIGAKQQIPTAALYIASLGDTLKSGLSFELCTGMTGDVIPRQLGYPTLCQAHWPDGRKTNPQVPKPEAFDELIEYLAPQFIRECWRLPGRNAEFDGWGALYAVHLRHCLEAVTREYATERSLPSRKLIEHVAQQCQPTVRRIAQYMLDWRTKNALMT